MEDYRRAKAKDIAQKRRGNENASDSRKRKHGQNSEEGNKKEERKSDKIGRLSDAVSLLQ